MRVYDRAALPGEARGGLERVRRLLRFDDPFLSADPRQPNARHQWIERLDAMCREVLDATELRFVPWTRDVPGEQRALDPEVGRRAVASPERLFYVADLAPGPGQRRREARSLAAAAVRSSSGEVLGLLEITRAESHAFGTDELALAALLADYCATILDRAARIEKLVFVDPMTGAFNRSYFEVEVQNEMARALRESSSLALCIVDIDDFKSFNTRYGYEGGNRVLIHVAQSLKRAVRPFDTVARWGGEEFAVLLTAPVQAPDVVTVSERLRSMVGRQQVWIEDLAGGRRRVAVTVSIGVALFPDHATASPELWRAANQALLEAKRPPKNRVVFYRPGGGPGPERA